MPRQYLEHLFNIVLKYNIFSFGSQVYRQVRGTAMGTKMAPSYANVFMDALEESFLATQDLQPSTYKRYIDDILILWNHSQDSLLTFIANLNRYHPTIKFTHEIHTKEIIFLDLVITKTVDSQIEFKTHFKKTNKFNYTAYSSAHPPSVKRATLRGELTRISRTTTNHSVRKKTIDMLSTQFKNRGYPMSTIQSIQDIQQKSLTRTQAPSRPIFKVQYHPHFINLKQDLLQHWHLISQNQTLKEIFSETPLICYTASKKLANS